MKYNKSMAQILREMNEATFVDNFFDANKPMSQIKADARRFGITIKVKKGGGQMGADSATLTGSESGIIKYAQKHLDASKKVRNLRDLKKELGEQEDPEDKAREKIDKIQRVAALKKQIQDIQKEEDEEDEDDEDIDEAPLAQKDAFVVTGGKGDNDQKVIGVFKDERSAKKARDDYNKKNRPAKKSHRARIFKQTRLSQAGKRFKPGEKIGYMTYSNKAQFSKLKEDLDDKDVDTIKPIIKQLKKSVKAHDKQAKQLQKDIEDETDLEEFTDKQIARLKKEYEQFRGKDRVSPQKFNKLRGIMKRFTKAQLLKVAKADIPILSSGAKASLVLNHGIKYASIPEDFIPYMEIFADDNKELSEQKKGKFKEVDPKVVDRIEKMMRGTRAEKDSIANMLNYFMPPEVVDMVRYKLKIVPKRGKIKF